ncbi:elongation factor 1-beta-like [Sesamum indicum]|uniref:Elongation factor 1-beta-like n=1 Tax=Sesamum indicum TaxID=4182 RepID=A0A6I9UGK0_SESIN|nr:elongation factor 1-beta-like [Sesamum indicum]
MADTFSDLHTESGLKALDQFLSSKSYISGSHLMKDDFKVYAAVLGKPLNDLYPNASKWYEAVSAKLAPIFPGKAVGVRIRGQATLAEAVAPAADAKTSTADDDDLDLFGDETEEDKKAAEQREATNASTKKKESEKSSIFVDIKPWDDVTNMKKLTFLGLDYMKRRYSTSFHSNLQVRTLVPFLILRGVPNRRAMLNNASRLKNWIDNSGKRTHTKTIDDSFLGLNVGIHLKTRMGNPSTNKIDLIQSFV